MKKFNLKNLKIKKLDIALFIGIIIAILVSSTNTFATDLEGISDNVLRLHILANSNSDEDQALKLKVRDEILKESSELFTEGKSRLEVEKLVLDNMDKIQKIAEKVIADNGYNYPVKCELTHMNFDTRVYDNITLPAGDYDALRITIGSAQGKNWWCVMYPSLCVAPSIKNSDLQTFSKSQVKVLKQPAKYQVRFKCVDVFNSIKSFFGIK